MRPSWRTNWRSAACAPSGNKRFRLFTRVRASRWGFRADLVVENLVIVEVKSVDSVAPVHKKQLLTHLRLAGKRLGLLINFNVALIKDGITRIANGLPE